MLPQIGLYGPDFKTFGKLGWSWGLVQILREGYTLPFRTRPNLTRSLIVISRYVDPHRNSYLLEALHQLIIDKNAIELVHNQTSLGFFNRLFMSSLCGVGVRVNNFFSKTTRPRDMLFFLKDTLSIEDEKLFKACKSVC